MNESGPVGGVCQWHPLDPPLITNGGTIVAKQMQLQMMTTLQNSCHKTITKFYIKF